MSTRILVNNDDSLSRLLNILTNGTLFLLELSLIPIQMKKQTVYILVIHLYLRLWKGPFSPKYTFHLYYWAGRSYYL